MSVGIKRRGVVSGSQRFIPLVVSAQSRSKPLKKKRVRYFQQFFEMVFHLFIRSEIVREVGPGHRPEVLHVREDEGIVGPQIY